MIPNQAEINLRISQGQSHFLRSIDPDALKGYTIEFFTSHSSSKGTDYYEALQEMRAIALERKISIVAHEEPMGQETMLRALCRAKGAIHLSLADANPRAVYDEVLAGLPIIVSKQSRVANALSREPFIVLTDLEQNDSQLGSDIKRFLELIESRRELNLDKALNSFASEKMEEHTAVKAMCRSLMICSG